MATYFVDSLNGSDGNIGSSGAPFASFSKANTVVVPGDTVNVRPGNGYAGGGGQITLTTSGSAAGGYIVYQGNPGDAVPVINGTSSFNTLQIKGSYIQVQGFEFAGPNGSITANGAWANATAAAVAGGQGGSAALYDGDGISANDVPAYVTAAGSSSTTALTISSDIGVTIGCAVCDVTNLARIPRGTQVINVVGGTALTLSNPCNGVVNGDMLFFASSTHHIRIYNNNIHDFPKCGISAFVSDYWDIRGNYIHDNALYWVNGPSGISLGFGFDYDTGTGYHHQIIGNIIWNNINKIASTGIFLAGPFTSSGTSSGTTLTLTGAVPSTIGSAPVNGFQVYDATSPGSSGAVGTIQPFTTIVSGQGTATLTLSQALASSIAAGHQIYISGFSDGEGVIIDTNHGNDFGQGMTIATVARTLIMNNLLFNNGSSGIQAFASNNVDICFNTCYKNLVVTYLQANEGEFSNYQTTGCNIFNNIFDNPLAVTLLAENGTSATWGNNLVFGGNGTTPPGTNNVTGQNPLLVSPSITPPTIVFPISYGAFQLQSGSPAKDVASATFTRTTDILGNPGQNGSFSDLGAFEFQGSPISPLWAPFRRWMQAAA